MIMDDKNFNTFLERWKGEENQQFIGWDFSYLTDRYITETPPWSYEEMVRELIIASRYVLDLGTGGGEKLTEFKDVLPSRTVATEGYPPNLKLARKRLAPLGIDVVKSNDSLKQELPFRDEAFDLVIDRHTSFNISEVERILTPGGIFLTEQVDGNNLHDLSEAFDCKQPWTFFTLDFVLKKIDETNLTVETASEWTGKAIFKDVGAIVYYLKAVPWTVPGFSVERNLAHLKKLQRRLEQEKELVFQEKLLLVKAIKS